VGLGAVIMGLILRWTSYRTMFLCLALDGLLAFVYYYEVVLKRERRELQAEIQVQDLTQE
jgi:predicted MFS family arabinose efflux permease